jgi:hypothetical protein
MSYFINTVPGYISSIPGYLPGSPITVYSSPSSPQYVNSILSPHVIITNKSENQDSIYAFPIDPIYDLNRDSDVQDSITKSIYNQIFSDWLYSSDFSSVFSYIKIVDGNPRLITNMKDKTEYHKSERDAKIRFIKKYILSKERVRKILKNFVEETRINWYDIEKKNSLFIKELVQKYIKKKLKALVEKKEQN